MCLALLACGLLLTTTMPAGTALIWIGGNSIICYCYLSILFIYLIHIFIHIIGNYYTSWHCFDMDRGGVQLFVIVIFCLLFLICYWLFVIVSDSYYASSHCFKNMIWIGGKFNNICCVCFNILKF